MKRTIFSLLFLFSLLSNSYAGPNDTTSLASDSIFNFDFPIQVSFFPGLGTNGTKSGEVTNNLSINVIAGYNGGVEGLEVGGFSNTLKGDMNGIQLAGFSNQVLGKTQGVQAAGFSNFGKQNANVLQLSGFANTLLKNSNAIQLSGFSNVVKGDFNGLQGSGFSNVVWGGGTLFQFSGFSNVVKGASYGVQISGFSNVATDSISGFQGAGFVNVASGKLDGFQVSGFINAAGEVDGAQLGFINIAKSYEQGAPIGFLSVVKEGFHEIEIGGTETMPANLAIKTGVEGFYNIFSFGFNPLVPQNAWSYGYGFGSMTRLTPKLGINADFIINHVSYGNRHLNELNLLTNLQVEANYFAKNWLTVYGGLSFNGFITEHLQADNQSFRTDVVPFEAASYNDGVVKQIYYPGVSLGVRF